MKKASRKTCFFQLNPSCIRMKSLRDEILAPLG
jgi:hypothetical protein